MESSTVSFFSSPPQAAPVDADAICLTRLSAHLEHLLDPAFLNRADAEIVLAAGGAVSAYSCFLTRSPLLLHHITSLPAGEKLRLELAELVPGGRHIRREALMEVLLYMYTGRLKFPRQECVDDECTHETCRPAIDFAVGCMYTASGFQIHELVSLFQIFKWTEVLRKEQNKISGSCREQFFLCQGRKLQNFLGQIVNSPLIL